MEKKKKKEEKGIISIHADLVLEIFSRSPVKTLSRLKCLSKEFAKIIQSQNFVDSCLSISSNRRLLFVMQYGEQNGEGGKLVFYSVSHRSNAPTRHDMTLLHGDQEISINFPPVRGLILCKIRHNQHVICHPATGQKLSLPQNKILVGIDRCSVIELTIFGHDPILNQFKVLSMVSVRRQYCQCFVLTVGQDGNIWRKIQYLPNQFYPSRQICGESGICINGVLYFKVFERTKDLIHDESKPTRAVSFDLNSEKFSFVEFNPHLSWYSGPLIDFQGKLGFISRVKDCEIEFSILMENKQWSSQVFHIPWVQEYKIHYENERVKHWSTYKANLAKVWTSSQAYYDYCSKAFCVDISRSVMGVFDGEIVFMLPRENFPGFTWHFHLEKKTLRKVKFGVPSDYPKGSFFVQYFANHFDTNVSL